MGSDILKSSESARSALLEIANSVSQFEWPSKEQKRKWTIIYEKLINKEKFDADIEISESIFIRIRRSVEKYFSNDNFSALVKYSRDFKLLCANLDSNKISFPPLTDEVNNEKLTKFLKDLNDNTNLREKSFMPLLSVNLRHENGIEQIKSYLMNEMQLLSNNVNPDIKSVIQHKDLYFEKTYVIELLSKTDEQTLEDSLQKIGIPKQFLFEKYKWFSGCFMNWIINRPHYNIELIQNNYERINRCSPDEIKVIEAFAIVKSNVEENSENFIQTFLELMKMQSADSETFWHLNNSVLQERFSKVLYEAYRVVRTMITRDFIHLVFNYLGMNTSLDTLRVVFWIKYAGSIKNFKIFMPDYEKRSFKNKILSSNEYKNSIYAEILETHSLKDRGNNPTGAIALIMHFGNLIVVEFPKTGKPIQICQPDNKLSKLFESRITWSELSEIQQYKDVQGERYLDNNQNKEGSLAHRGYWEGSMQQILRNYGILTDKGRN